jgi:chemotaxis response regulator CheB
MPGEAYKIGAASEQYPLEQIAKELLKRAQE